MIKRVLVYTYGDQSHENTIRAAAGFAQANGAKLFGLFVKPDMMGYSSIYGTYPMNLARTFYDLQKDYAENARQQFEKIVPNFEISTEWHEVEQYEKKPRSSAYADIIFVSQPDKESSVIFNDTDFVDQIILNTGLPVLIVPKAWSEPVLCNRPALAWKETKEAIGAVRQCLDLMRNAESVDVVTINQNSLPEEELVEGIGICEYLAEHKIKTEFFSESRHAEDADAADALFRHVTTQNRNVLISGSYGHSRMRQIILGGMTRALIKRSPVPVLMSH